MRQQAEARLRERERVLGEDLAVALRERDDLVSVRCNLEVELDRQHKLLSDQTQKLSSMGECISPNLFSRFTYSTKWL